MLKNFDQEIKEADGKIFLQARANGKYNKKGEALVDTEEVKDDKGTIISVKAKLSPLTFSDIIGDLLRNTTQKETLSNAEYKEQWRLQKKILNGGDIEISATEITLINDLLLKSKMNAFIIGQILEYLDEKPEDKKGE